MDKDNLPRHVAIIPDGNRRWARKKGIAPWRGHIAGAKKAVEQAQAALDLGIYCLSIWGGSWDNLTKRPKIETRVLCRIYEQYFRKTIKSKEVRENEVKVSVIGRWQEILPKSAVKAGKELIKTTEHYNKHLLNYFIAYDGVDEILESVRDIVKESRKGVSPKILPEYLRKHLWSGHLPPVDLLIRTGSWKDPHNSAGFMMYNCAYSQLYFPKNYYPDFGRAEFIKAIKEYQRRERRLGK